MRLIWLAVVLISTNVPAAPLTGEAQQTGHVYRIGFLAAEERPPQEWTVFVGSLRELGYTEGQNLIVERRYSGGVPSRVAALATELVRLKLDLIITSGGHAAAAAKQGTLTIPIVSINVSDLVRVGLAKSQARPGGNLTGFAVVGFDLTPKLVEILKEAVPVVSKIAVLGNPPAAGHGVLRDRIVEAARNRDTAVMFVEVQEPGDYDAAFATIRKERADAILALPDPLNGATAQREKVAEFALKNRLPTIAIWRPYAESGFLIAYD